MFDFGSMQNKMMDKFFRRVNNVVWDLMSGKIGIVTSEGIASIEGEGEDAQVSINMMEGFGVALPAFAQNTAVSDLKIGDLIFNGKKTLGWITATPTAKRKSFTLLKQDGTRANWTPPKVTMMGFDGLGGAMVLRSLINSLPDGGLGSMQSMLLPMMMMGGDDIDLESMLPVMLFSQSNAGKDGKGGGMDMNNMMMPMMMMGMMKGKKKKRGGLLSGGMTNFFDTEGDDE